MKKRIRIITIAVLMMIVGVSCLNVYAEESSEIKVQWLTREEFDALCNEADKNTIMYNDYNNVLMPMSDDYLGYFIEGDGNITTYVKRYVGKNCTNQS